MSFLDVKIYITSKLGIDRDFIVKLYLYISQNRRASMSFEYV